MPKIIENVRDDILAEAKKQVMENGFSNMTVRSVASGCGIATGTIYNYFKSKSEIVASFMLYDWVQIREKTKQKCLERTEPRQAVLYLWNGLVEFRNIYRDIYKESSAEKEYEVSIRQKHPLFRKQLREIIRPACEKFSCKNEFLPEFIRENVLTWSSEGKDFDTVYSVFEHMFSKGEKI